MEGLGSLSSFLLSRAEVSPSPCLKMTFRLSNLGQRLMMMPIRDEKDSKAGNGMQTFRLVKFSSRVESIMAKISLSMTAGGS